MKTPPDYSGIAEYVPRPDLDAAIVVDLDGTVAIHGDERGHYEYEKVDGDRPNWPVIDAVQALSNCYYIIFMSGREDRCRDITKTWLDKYFKWPVGSTLFMRTTGDHRPDWIVKSELFDAHVRGNWDIRMVMDDRTQVVNMWRSLGLVCLQVAPGDF